MSDIDYEINFTDLTLLEGEGNYDEVKKIMHNEAFAGDSWMLLTEVSLTAFIGGKPFESLFILHFYANGDVYINAYQSSSGDVYYNPDITGLAHFIKKNNWKSLRPSKDLVRDNTDFWKHFWDTYIIDSDYLDMRFGVRDEVEYQ